MTRSKLSEARLKFYSDLKSEPCVFLESLIADRAGKTSYFFSDFDEIVCFNHGDDLDLFFEKLETYRKKGFWLAGFLSMNSATALSQRFRACKDL